MKVRVLGDVHVEVEGTEVQLGGPKQRSVLALLAASAGSAVSTDRLIDGIWGSEPPQAVRSSLHAYVSNLRTALGGGIERAGNGYRLATGPADVDAGQFEELLATGRRLAGEDPEESATVLRRALELWRGPPYADLAGVEGLQAEIRRLEALRLEAIEARIRTDLELGRHRIVIGELESLIEEHPYRESLWALHMTALYREGRQAEALRAYRRLHQTLVEEVGVDPTPELQELEWRILNHDPELAGPAHRRRTGGAMLACDVDIPADVWETDGEATERALVEYDRTLSAGVEGHGGRVVRRDSNFVLATLPDAETAAALAVSLQSDQQLPNSRPLSRMAIDVAGDSAGGDGFVDPAARVTALVAMAHPGQILVSDVAHDALAHGSSIATIDLGEYALRAIPGTERVHQVTAEAIAAHFPALRTSKPDRAATVDVGDTLRSYELRQRIGSGRFGVVYRAYQRSIGREVAIKVIRPELANDASFVRRFESEARLVAKLDHPRIVTLFDYWRDHEGAYLVMPYLRGGSLESADVPFGEHEVRRILAQIGSALSHAHHRSVVHGDIRPSNVLRDDVGNAYLADFGLALHQPGSSSSRLATPARWSGSPYGHHGARDDDIYSLGVLGTWLATGMRPRDGGIDALPPSLRLLLSRAAATDESERYSNVAEFVEQLGVPEFTMATHGVTGPARNPYKGLAAYEAGDAADFYGRDDEVADLIGLLRNHRLVTVVGPSGSGKSSLVRAGLLPALERQPLTGSDEWLTATFLPGRHPFERLAAALGAMAVVAAGALDDLRAGACDLATTIDRVTGGPDTEVVLVIDQFEELYTRTSDEDRRKFLDVVLAAITGAEPRVRVVAAIRADFFDKPLADPELGELVSSAHLAIAVPDGKRLYEIITRPAAAAGIRFEPDLAAEIAGDVSGQPGALPLLQFVLVELAESAHDGLITHAAYDQIGGVNGAIGRRADDVLAALDTVARDAARQLLLRLVTVTPEGDEARRRARLAELYSLHPTRGVVDAVLEAFEAARLITFDTDPTSRGPTVEFAHEALLTEWKALESWITEEREALLVRRRLAQLVDEWEERGAAEPQGEPDEGLLTPGQLVRYEEWAAATRLSLTEAERRFLAASRQARDAAQRRQSRLRRLAFAAITLVAVLGVGLALVSTSNARRTRVLAADALVGDAQFHLSTGEWEEAALGLVESHNLHQSLLAMPAMGEIINGRQEWGRSMATLGDITAVEVAVDWEHGVAAIAGAAAGSGAATASRLVPVLDIATGETVVEIESPGLVGAVAFLSDGTLVTGSDDGRVVRWDPATGAALSRPHDMGASISDLTIAADDVVVVSTFRPTADAGTEAELSSRVEAMTADAADGWESVATFDLDSLSSDGESLAGRVEIVSVLVAPESDMIVTVGSPLLTASWDLTSGEPLHHHLAGEPTARAGVWGGAFSHDGGLLVTSHQDRTLLVRDAVTLEPIAEPTAPATGQQRSVSFLPDDHAVVSSGQNGVLLWDVTEDGSLGTNPEQIATTVEVRTHGHVLSPDGSRLIVAASDRVRAIDLERGLATQPRNLSGTFWTVAVDGADVWFGGQGPGHVHWWDRHSGETATFDVGTSLVPSLEAAAEAGRVLFTTEEGIAGRLAADGTFDIEATHTDRTWAIAWSPDRTRLATVSADNRLAVRDAVSLEPMLVLEPATPGGPSGLKSVAYVDDTTIVTGGWDGFLRTWDITDQRQTLELQVIADQLNAVAVLDETHVVVGDERGTISVVDLERAEVTDTLDGHTSSIRALDLSPDGTTLASAGQDNAVRLWDVESRAQVGLFRHLGAVRALEFDDDGKTLVAADTNGEVVVWDVDWRSWPERLCEWLATWDLRTSWPKVMGDQPYDPACVR